MAKAALDEAVRRSPIRERIKALDVYRFITAPHEVASLSRDDARLVGVAYQDLAAKIETVKAAVAMRLAEPEPDGEPDRVLTVAEVAARLGRKTSYVGELIRKRQIPAVLLPSTKPGKEGKYSGVLESSLRAWWRDHEDRGVR